MNKGFLGISLKLQTFVIATSQFISSTSLACLAAIMLHSPENFIKDWANIQKSENAKIHYINEIGENAVELLVGALTIWLASILLILGIKKNSTGLILPWVVINIGDLAGGIIVFISKLSSPRSHLGPSKIGASICYFLLSIYFIKSVHAYYKSLKRQKQFSREMLQLSTTTLNSELSISTTTELRTFPSSRPQSLKSQKSSDDDDDFILYEK